jgi:hypothetical protein
LMIAIRDSVQTMVCLPIAEDHEGDFCSKYSRGKEQEKT